MSKGHDRDLGMYRKITRRDFVNGVGVAVTGSMFAPSLRSPQDLLSRAGRMPTVAQEYYPPAMTGMRGSHPGSFEVAHGLRDGNRWAEAGAEADTGEHYDLVVVGAGLSGLSAAYFFQTSAGRGARVLILDNHDDFGGHAKRNEFTYGGRTLLLNGGTSNLESINHYSTVARTLLSAVGLDLEKAADASAASGRFYRSLGLGSATFFARETFGEDRLVKGQPGRSPSGANEARRLGSTGSPRRLCLQRCGGTSRGSTTTRRRTRTTSRVSRMPRRRSGWLALATRTSSSRWL